MFRYRQAIKDDANNIAALHAVSWQINYRGILDNHYLDHEVVSDRKNVWQKRFKRVRNDMSVILAEKGNELVGFGCVFFRESEKYGAYLDNLHVVKAYSGRGIGKNLMSLLASEILKNEERKDMYLWVLKENEGAIRLYERLMGQKKELVMERELWEQPVEKIRYYWPNVQNLMLDKNFPK